MYYFPQFLIFHTAKLHKKKKATVTTTPLPNHFFLITLSKQVYLKLVMPWT